MAGASHVVLPRFNAMAVFDAIQDHHVTSMIIVPTMLADLVATSTSTIGYFLNTLRDIIFGFQLLLRKYLFSLYICTEWALNGFLERSVCCDRIDH